MRGGVICPCTDSLTRVSIFVLNILFGDLLTLLPDPCTYKNTQDRQSDPQTIDEYVLPGPGTIVQTALVVLIGYGHKEGKRGRNWQRSALQLLGPASRIVY